MKHQVDAFLAFLASERGLAANTLAAYHNDLNQFAEYLTSRPATDGIASVASAPMIPRMGLIMNPTRNGGTNARTAPNQGMSHTNAPKIASKVG